VRHHLWEADAEVLRAAAAGEPAGRVRHWSDTGRSDTAGGQAPSLAPDAEPFDVVMGGA
jgi:hypothetical protein